MEEQKVKRQKKRKQPIRPMESRRHKLVENVDQSGKPQGTYRCLTCLAGK